jgi:predicted amidophosphoribosyltransferase
MRLIVLLVLLTVVFLLLRRFRGSQGGVGSRRCPHCGQQIPAVGMYCPICGRRVV